ncbi:hypothetical protein AX17_005935 [Amanita inopinata Kibby_2008]|nr:hypothetical protein AX17_005935 [Amanita inopinata Kibby_2008]
MGGLLAADTLLELAKSHRDTSSLWPRIVACISFDTPYLGLHPSVFKNSVTKAAEVVGTAQTVGSTIFGALGGLKASKIVENRSQQTSQDPKGWNSWAAPAAFAFGGALLAGAAFGGAWSKREDLGQGYQWATDHMKFIGNLWDEKTLQKRVDDLIALERSHNVIFRTFYTLMPPTPPQYMASRTFISLPKAGAPAASKFLPAKNNLAADEIQAHIGMFAPVTNDGYYELGLDAVGIIREASKSLEPPA